MMTQSRKVWAALMLVAGLLLLVRGVTTGMGATYVEQVETVAVDGETVITTYETVNPNRRQEDGVSLSLARTVGVWLAALLTLCVFSFLYGDNVFYKLAEAVFVGVSAAYVMVVGFWKELRENLLGNLLPDLMRSTVSPGIEEGTEPDLMYLIPLGMSVLMLWRLAPKGAWIARWPLAFFIGATAGMRMVVFFESDFIAQIQGTVIPLVVFAGGQIDFWASVRNTLIVLGVLSSLVYFFFSVEHTGPVHAVSKVGIWVLMITFGASFANTVMARIALLAQRLEFLFDDWLWLIDPLQRRIGM